MTNQDFQKQFPILMELIKHAYDAQSEIKYAGGKRAGIGTRLEVNGSLPGDNEYYGLNAKYADENFYRTGVEDIQIFRHANTAKCSDARWSFIYEPVGVMKTAEQPYRQRMLSFASYGMTPEEAYADFVKHYKQLKKQFDKACESIRSEIAEKNAERIAELQAELERLSVGGHNGTPN